MMKFLQLVPILALWVFPNLVVPEGLLKPMDVIKRDGHLAVSDGSSLFIFYKDGSFESGPLGLSGRTIKGKWVEHKSGGYWIEGKWSWINGVSEPNDFRTMLVHIGWLSDEAQELASPIYGKLKIRKAYFFIDLLQKVSK